MVTMAYSGRKTRTGHSTDCRPTQSRIPMTNSSDRQPENLISAQPLTGQLARTAAWRRVGGATAAFLALTVMSSACTADNNSAVKAASSGQSAEDTAAAQQAEQAAADKAAADKAAADKAAADKA